jgi:Flp pilus assembly protein TadG
MGMTRQRRAAPAGRQTGAVTAELVVATPLLLLLVLLVVQFALWQHGLHVATAAAEEGERAARLEGGTAAAGAARTREFLATLGPNLVVGPRVTVQRSQTTARVEIHATAEQLVPWLHLPIHAVAEGPVEVFTAPAAGGPP